MVILDGTLSSLRDHEISNAGQTFRLLAEGGPRPGRTLWYDEGIPWRGWRRIMDVIEGRGIEDQIIRAYGHLASHYRAGDRIFLFGYSRGAFAVRSLAGVIDRVGLLRQEEATERNVLLAWRHYQRGESAAAAEFARAFCHPSVGLRMVGVWETVKALGWRFPLLWMLTESRHAFHNPHPAKNLDYGFHALALDETRVVFEPVLWQSGEESRAHIEQAWFRGGHGDVGGQIGGYEAARPLANIPLVWMLDRAESAGLMLPANWRMRFPCDPAAPMAGTWRGWGAWFLYRRRRRIGRDPTERLHESVPETARLRWRLARGGGFAPDQPATSQAAESTSPISRG